MTKIKTKKQKAEKINVKRKLKFEDYKHCSETTQLDDVTKENIKEHNPSQLKIPDHLYIIMIIGGSRLGKQMHYLI